MKHVIIGLIVLSQLVASNALAYQTDWFVIDRLLTGDNSSGIILVITSSDLDIDDGGCTNSTEITISGSDAHYEELFKMLNSAFLTGKQVKGNFDSCSSNRAIVDQIYVCVDGTSCGQ